MSHFAYILYWFRGVARFEDLPEGYRLRWSQHNSNAGSVGPGDGRGLLLANGADNAVVSYKPERQRWDDLGNGIWIGASLDSGPGHFAREAADRSTANYTVTLGDGHPWQLPILNPLSDSFGLPTWDVRCGVDQWRREPQDRYRELADEAMAIAGACRQAFIEGGDLVAIDDERLRSFLARGIAINYDLQLDEMSVLRLFDPRCYMNAAFAMIDWPTMREMLEAGTGDEQNPTVATPATSASASGAPASPPITNPPA